MALTETVTSNPASHILFAEDLEIVGSRFEFLASAEEGFVPVEKWDRYIGAVSLAAYRDYDAKDVRTMGYNCIAKAMNAELNLLSLELGQSEIGDDHRPLARAFEMELLDGASEIEAIETVMHYMAAHMANLEAVAEEASADTVLAV